MQNLYHFRFDCGRMGSLTGIFVADDQEIEKEIGKELYFGEVLGKHSEIFGEFKKEQLTILTNDQDFIKKFLEFDCSSGYSPLDYLPEEFGDDDEDEDEDEDED